METERLFIRKYEPKDRTDFINLFTDEAVMKYVDRGVLMDEQAAAFWRKLFEKLYPQKFNIWAVFAKESGEYAGHAGIYPRPSKSEDWEFVYFLTRKNWGNGYATEIAQRVIRFGFEELHLPRVYATVDNDHSASIRVLEKAGMQFENYEEDEEGQYSVYSISKS